MKHLPLYTIICWLLVAASAVTLVLQWPVPAALLSLTGFMLVMKDISRFTSWLQFSAVLVSGIMTGIAVEYPFAEIPWLTITFFVAALGTIGRVMFFRVFAYTGHTWFEPLMLVLALGIHITGVVLPPHNWIHWLFPLPAFLFSGIITYGILNDKRQLLGATAKGYRVAIGTEAPQFSLPDQDGNLVSLSEFKGERHLLLIFVRGDWCPGCHMMLRTYQRESERFRQKNIFVMSIGPDPVGVNRDMVERLGLEFKVLADEGQRTAMTYGVQLEEFDHGFAEKYEEGIPLPASFLIDKNGIVRYVSRPDKVGEFLNPSLIFPIIEKLN